MPAVGRPANRRQVTLALFAAAGALALVAACEDGGTSAPSDTSPDPDDTAWPAGDWATGGTAAIASTYGDPFADDTTCLAIGELTLGPCYAQTEERQDISEGVSGLPVRLALKVVDASCAPVSGAVVDIWHCAPNGLYSGSDAANMCTDGDSAARASRWFRGTQTTDADGRVDFDTCFPGWYGGRAVHIHFQVRRNGQVSRTSQLFFEQSLITRVFDEHPEYVGYGQPDTPNSADDIASGADPESVTLQAERQADGVLLAWKTVALG